MAWKNVSKKEKKVVVKVKVPTYKVTVLKGNAYITLTPDIVDFLGKPERVCVLADVDDGLLGVCVADDSEESVKTQYSKTSEGKTPTMTVLARNAIALLEIDASEGALVAEAEFDSSADESDADESDDDADETEPELDIVFIDISRLTSRAKAKEEKSE